MKLLYTEFLLPIKHYFFTLTGKEAIFDLIIPSTLGILSFILGSWCDISINQTNSIEFIKTLITLLSILIGFSITSLTIIASTTELTGRLMTVKTERKVGNKILNLYQLMNITFIMAIFSEILTLILNLSAVLFISADVQYIINNINLIIVINIMLISHILLLNIRNVTNFYFVFHNAISEK